PIWFPVNYLLIEVLRVYHRYLGDSLRVECPTGSGNAIDLGAVADELAGRLIGIFCRRADGPRPVFGSYRLLQQDPPSTRPRPFQPAPAWTGPIPFHEYFHGDTGAGLGASHQTGWTGLVADLIIRRARGHAPSSDRARA